MTIDDEIRRLRAQGMGLADVARRLGVTISRVNQVDKQKPAPTPFADTSATIRIEQLSEEVAKLRRELAAMARLQGELRELRDRVDVLGLLLEQSNERELEPAWSDWMGASELAPVLGVEAKFLRTKLRGSGVSTMAGRMVESRRGLTEEERQRHAPGTRILYRYEVQP